MAALPKKKPSNPYQKDRRHQAQLKYEKLNEWAVSAKGTKRVLKTPSHKVDLVTGKYKDKQVVDFETREQRKKRQIEKLEKAAQG